MKPYTSDFKPFSTFPYQLPKVYLQFHNQKIFNETCYIWLSTLLSSCYTYTLSTILEFSSFAFK